MAQRTKKASSYDPREVEEHIIDTPLSDEMSTSFLEYAYSVIYARALPDARDGMKPVQRRIIYQMGQMNLTPDRPYMKSARVVGEVMGKLHPHGDSAIYEAMVRLAQPFAMRLPLVDGHGNFGSLDDGPAASRYTEARLGPAALAMNASIDEDTVDFTPNYDNKLQEPTVLPSALPNLLVNGASGIAVGMATNMPTHNLGEVIGAAKYLMHHPDATVDELMEYVPGPDLPGGGIIMGRDGIRQAYESGRGMFITRARTHVENVTARKKAIVVTELPFMVGPEKVLEKISDGVKNKKLDGISSAIDLTDRHNGTRLVIEIKTGFDPQAVLAQLFRHTPLEDSFAINNVALVNGRPHTMGLKELLEVWVEHRRDVITRRSKCRLRKAQERLHLVDGLLLALVDIDQVIAVIRTSDDAEQARRRLIETFDLDDTQAQYILDLRLRRLTKMSRIELEAERDDLRRRIDELNEILGSTARRDAVVEQEMDEVAARYGSPRRTVLLDMAEDGSMKPVVSKAAAVQAQAGGTALAALSRVAASASATVTRADAQGSAQLDDAPCVVLMGCDGLVARAPMQAWHALRARTGSTPRMPGDTIGSAIRTTTLSTFGIVTSAGRLVVAHAADLPALAMPTDDGAVSVQGGVKADDLLGATQSTDPVDGEHAVCVVALAPAPADDGGSSPAAANDAADDAAALPPLAIGTRNGVVKRWNREAPTTMDSWPIIDLKDGDEVMYAADAPDDARLVFVSSDSSLLTFDASAVRPQGRTAGGMNGIRLADGAHVVAFAVVPADAVAWSYETNDDGLASGSGTVVLTVAGDSDALPGVDPGAAKITPLDQYPTKGRSTGGVRSQRFLKGQNAVLLAHVGAWPLIASSAAGSPVDLPAVDMRRDGSGTDLATPIAYVA
ncbi:MAG: DNA topoisomerase IV subunit A [Bifidobacteriaceae bacterium]|nr:DNA topoisomerase IV subunit A [Bifidobacteriaceae bacterium]